MKVGVLVSGNGTNLQALLDAQAAGTLAPATIACVVSNKAGVRALERADAAGVSAHVVDHRNRSREAFETAVIDVLDTHGVEAVILAGFMRVLTTHFVAQYPLRIVNTHPSLLPAFPGVDAPAQALAYGVKLTGVTVHFVDTSLDGGPIIAQVAVPIAPGDDAAALHAKIQREEHRLLPRVARDLASGRLTCEGRIVTTGHADE